MSNFEFLKSIDKNLFDIISNAEELFRDEYYEQVITQTRRFAEVVCKNTLGTNRTTEKTFDEMLATLKDKSNNAEVEKEFIDDLYFLKREGNSSTHAETVKNDGSVALECLQRAFEVALNYAIYRSTSSKKADLLKLRFDIDLLATGKKSKKTLSEKYNEKKSNIPKKTKNKIKQSHSMKTKKAKNNSSFSWFKLFLKISIFISTTIISVISILSYL